MRDLRVSFQIDRDHTFEAVKGISFDIPRNRTVALVGESGSGKSVTSLAILGLLPPENSIIGKGSEILYGGRNLLELDPAELRKLRGADISMIFQEPMTSLNPVFTCGFQLTEVLRLHMGMTGAQAQEARARAAGRSRHPRPRVQDQRLPVADVGRPAAAGDDRDGDRLRAQAPDRRRADHGARRHHPEADPRPHRGAAEEAPDVGAVHHARPRGRRRHRRRRRRDAQRRDPRAGPGARCLRESAGRLHQGAAQVPPAARPPADAAARDRGLHGRQRARPAAHGGARARRPAGRPRRARGAASSARTSTRARASSARGRSRR